MRRDNKSTGIKKAGPEGRVVRGGGVLQLSEQHSPGDAGEAGEAIRFLILFTKALIRNNPSSDVLYLSLMSAATEAGISKETAQNFISWVMSQQDQSYWPKGFFS